MQKAASGRAATGVNWRHVGRRGGRVGQVASPIAVHVRHGPGVVASCKAEEKKRKKNRVKIVHKVTLFLKSPLSSHSFLQLRHSLTQPQDHRTVQDSTCCLHSFLQCSAFQPRQGLLFSPLLCEQAVTSSFFSLTLFPVTHCNN